MRARRRVPTDHGRPGATGPAEAAPSGAVLASFGPAAPGRRPARPTGSMADDRRRAGTRGARRPCTWRPTRARRRLLVLSSAAAAQRAARQSWWRFGCAPCAADSGVPRRGRRAGAQAAAGRWSRRTEGTAALCPWRPVAGRPPGIEPTTRGGPRPRRHRPRLHHRPLR
jgi:hypothetical protein